MTIRSRMSSIMDLIGPEHLELFALDLKKKRKKKKKAVFHFVYTLASTNINQSAQNFVKIRIYI